MEILEDSAGDLTSGQLGTLNAAHLGGSSSGAELGHHTSIAHKHVVKAMEQMVLGLRGYQANVQKFHKDIDFVDEDSGAASTRTTGKVNGVVPSMPQSDACAAPSDFDTNDQCVIPGDKLMAQGPNEARFRTSLQGASYESVDDGAMEWRRCADLLDIVSRSLETAAGKDQKIGGQTGPAMGAAFRRTSKSVADRAGSAARGQGGAGIGRAGDRQGPEGARRRWTGRTRR